MQAREVGNRVAATAQDGPAGPFAELAVGHAAPRISELLAVAQEAARGMVEAEDALRLVGERFQRTEDPDVRADLAAEALDHVERQLGLTRQRRQGLDSIEGTLWARRNGLERFLIHTRGRVWWHERRQRTRPETPASDRT
jgi:hypothetical protein